MSRWITFNYYVSFGKGDGSETMTWEAMLTEEEEQAYLKAKIMRESLDSVPELQAVYNRVKEEVEEEEASNLAFYGGDEEVREMLGLVQVDEEEIERLVRSRDPYTWKYFELSEMSDEELAAWSVKSLGQLPDVCEFVEDFEPENPFDSYVDLCLDFKDNPEEDELTEDEARELLEILFEDSYEAVNAFVDRWEDGYWSGELSDLAEEVAKELGNFDYRYGDEEDDEVHWEDYEDYPFAMEVVNGDVISLTADMQRELAEKLAQKAGITLEELGACLLQLEEDEETENEVLSDLVSDCGELAEVLGYDVDEQEFTFPGIGYLEASCGWDAVEVMKFLGYDLEENIRHAPFEHGTDGVVFYE